MSTWSFYSLETGLFTGRVSSASKLGKVPDGCGAMVGRYDRLSQRVDLDTGEVVEHRDEALNAARQREARARAARRRIARLEAQQARPLRELAIDPNNAAAKQRLAEIDAQIAELRTDIAT